MTAPTPSLREREVILLIDDAPDTVRMIAEALDEAGYTVLVATDGATALKRLERITPDAVLLDACMPGMDGFETCRRLKQAPGMRTVPVIFMTGWRRPSAWSKACRPGASTTWSSRWCPTNWWRACRRTCAWRAR